MPSFVPVVDVEKPRNERDTNSDEYQKHRRWEAPHSSSTANSRPTVKRGWEQGNLGWGVLGSFGSSEKDDGSTVVRKHSDDQKMIKNDKGLWVRSKEVAEVRSSGAGRGGGIPLIPSRESEPSFQLSSSSSKDSSSNRRPRSSSRDRSRHHRSRSRDRHRRRSRSRSRDTSHKIQRRNETNDVKTIQPVHDEPSPSKDINISAEPHEVVMTAIQVVNRLLEVFEDVKSSSSKRIDNITELFSDDARISSLKSGKVFVTGTREIRESFGKTFPCLAEASKRAFVDLEKDQITFCFDCHGPATSPGLGDRSKDTVLLYKCAEGKIVQVWGMADSEKLGSRPSLTKEAFLASEAWKLALAIITSNSGLSTLSSEDIHFHNYSKIETWG